MGGASLVVIAARGAGVGGTNVAAHKKKKYDF